MFKHLAALSIAITLGLTGCRYFQSEATITIQALDGEGEALPNARVLVNKAHVGQTDDRGFFQGQLELPVEEPLLVEVSKASKETFFAPYFETIKVKRGDLNTFKLTATLYGLKPSLSEALPAPSDGEIEGLAKPEAAQTLPPGEPTLPSPTLSTADEAVAESDELLPEAESPRRSVTVYTVSGRDAIEGATAYYGDVAKRQWVQGCLSNASGRCSILIPDSLDSVTILVRAKGYQTQSRSFSLIDGDKIRFELDRGKSLEVFAINPNQGSREGVEGVRITVDDKVLGSTDRFGSFIAPQASSSATESRITLTADQWLPSRVEYKRSQLTSESIIQHFQSLKPIAPRIAVMDFIHFRTPGTDTLLSPPSLESLNTALQSAGGNVLNSAALLGKFAQQKLSLDELSPANFNQLKKVSESIHYILRPSFIEGPEARIILSVIDLNGKMVFSASQSVKALGAATPALSDLAQRVIQNIRHEGSIVEAVGDEFRINLGKNQGLIAGDKVQITGNSRLASGEITAWDAIASGTITEIAADRSRIKIIQSQPYARIEPGNSIALERTPVIIKDALSIQVQEAGAQGPISLAEIYRGEQWLGSTDSNGQINVPEIDMLKSGEITIFSPGFIPKTQAIKPELKAYVVALDHLATAVQIESQPQGATVKINGRDLGRTPIDTEIPYPGTRVNLEIGGVDGFELVARTQSVGARGIVLRGNTQITLNRDPLQAARAMVVEGKLVDAAQILAAIPENDNSYLLAQHQLGELFLNLIHDPVKAANAFHRVTSSPKVENFQDKRFIGTHINEAVALFRAGENAVAADQNLAISFWRQVEAILSKTEAELRFVPQDQYTQAVHTLNYYRALALHKTWTVTQNSEDQKSALQYWKDYIQGTALALPQDQHYDWVKKAETYFQQIQTARKPPMQNPKAPVAM